MNYTIILLIICTIIGILFLCIVSYGLYLYFSNIDTYAHNYYKIVGDNAIHIIDLSIIIYATVIHSAGVYALQIKTAMPIYDSDGEYSDVIEVIVKYQYKENAEKALQDLFTNLNL